MIGEKQGLFDGREVQGRASEVVITTSASVTTYAMSVYETVVRIVLAAAHSLTLTLPPVAVAVGKFYSIRVITDGGSGAAVAVTDAGDETTFPVGGSTTIALVDVPDGVLLFSDGHNWWFVASSGLTATSYD
jgi:ABC-type glycerol-3-phosphate transport system permease component